MSKEKKFQFEIIEHTADIGIQIRGKTLEEVFAAAAYGMFSLIVDMEDVEEREEKEIQISSSDRESLLVEWLNEFIYLFDVEKMIFRRFDFSHLDDTSLHAFAFGERLDPKRHKVKLGIKAATYHMLKVEKEDGYVARVIFDI